MPGNTVRIAAQVTGTRQASSDLDRMKDKFTALQKQGGKGFAIGVGAAVTAKGFSLLDRAASAVIGTLGDATQAAMDDERSQVQLRTALENNVTAWDGNTAAIEEVLSARIKLGFSDDEQRDSLATLATATHDVNEALALEAGAMDLARRKGVPLATAADAVAKAYAGNVKQLKTLIPGLKLGATSAETLANAFASVEGQAAAYANTNAGKLETSQVRVGEAMEKLGAVIMPIVAEAMVAAADAIDVTADALDTLADVADGVGPKAGSFFKKTGDAAEDMADRVADYSSFTAEAIDKMTDNIVGDAERLSDEFFDPIESEWDRHDARVELAAAIQKGASREIIRALRKQGDALGDLGQDHKLTAKQVDRYEADVKKSYAALGKKVPAELQRIIDKLRTLQGIEGTKINIDVSHQTTFGNGPKASGGVARGMTLVGERGPEVVDLPPGSFVHPSTGKERVGGGVTNVFNITGADVSSPQRIRDVIARGMRVSQGNPWAADGPWGT